MLVQAFHQFLPGQVRLLPKPLAQQGAAGVIEQRVAAWPLPVRHQFAPAAPIVPQQRLDERQADVKQLGDFALRMRTHFPLLDDFLP
jgi:hypothetical protein